MKKILILVSLIILFFSSTPHADNDGVTDWRMQAVDSYEEADKELNRVYNLAIQKIKNEGSASVLFSEKMRKEWIEKQRESQRAWIKFRDLDSEIIEYTWLGGSGMGAAQLGWKQMLTEKRIDELKKQYNLK